MQFEEHSNREERLMDLVCGKYECYSSSNSQEKSLPTGKIQYLDIKTDVVKSKRFVHVHMRKAISKQCYWFLTQIVDLVENGFSLARMCKAFL